MSEENARTIQKGEHIHHKFTEEEDQSLKEIVAACGTTNWSIIAAQMPKRNPRQCRDRWMNYLNPDLNTTGWTPDEDERLLKLHSQIGCRWVQITRAFPNRTDTMIKNRFNILQRRRKTQAMRARPPGEGSSDEHTEMWETDDFFTADFPVITLM